MISTVSVLEIGAGGASLTEGKFSFHESSRLLKVSDVDVTLSRVARERASLKVEVLGSVG